MSSYLHLLLPELILTTVACVLMLIGCSNTVSVRRSTPMLALLALIVVAGIQCARISAEAQAPYHVETDPAGTLHAFHFTQYVKLLVAAVGAMLVLLAWPSNPEANGNSAMNVGQETGEFFALMLLSLTGVMLTAGANDLILLFLGIELASIPTYIMVSISRPLPAAQEAGVKYFFLGAMAAAVMLFGFSYLYGVTGSIKLDVIARALHAAPAAGETPFANRPYDAAYAGLSPWQLLAVVMLIGGFAFKLAAVPLHVYAGDVYQGAATPVTAFLSFVPKTSGMVALIKILACVGGPAWAFPPTVIKLLWIVAALTMTFGNVLALSQYNIKRLLAYSSIAHSGYMLVAITALVSAYQNVTGADRSDVQTASLTGVLFYLTAYGVTNAAAFGVLMFLPSRDTLPGRPATSAETIEDLAGQGRRHPGLGLCMAVCCFSLIGIPLTVGFLGKVFLIQPALKSGNDWLAVITVVNAAISAAYYLRIVATMFLRDPAAPLVAEPSTTGVTTIHEPARSFPIAAGIGLSVVATLLLGIVLPVTNIVTTSAQNAARVDEDTTNKPVAAAAALPAKD